MKDIPDERAARLRDLRKEKGLTLKQAAELLSEVMHTDVHFTTVGKLETGKMQITVDWLVALARAYGVTIHDTLSGSFKARPATVVPAYQLELDPFAEDMFAGPIRMEKTSRKLGSAVSPDVSEDAFALTPIPPAAWRALSGLSDPYVVIDPQARELADQYIYAVRTDHGDELARFIAKEMAFVPIAKDGFQRPIRIGEIPFEVLGRAVFLGASLIP